MSLISGKEQKSEPAWPISRTWERLVLRAKALIDDNFIISKGYLLPKQGKKACKNIFSSKTFSGYFQPVHFLQSL